MLRQLGLLTNRRSLLVFTAEEQLVVEHAATGEQVALAVLSDELLGAQLELPLGHVFSRDQPNRLTLRSASGKLLEVGARGNDRLVFRHGSDAFVDPASWKRIGPRYRPLTLRRRLTFLLPFRWQFAD